MDPVHIDVGETYGGMMIGILFASLLCGAASVQAIIFFRTNRIEPLSHKIPIAFIWMLDMLQLCFIFSATYFYVVQEGPHDMISPPFIWNFKIQILMQVLIMSSTKLMYALRLWRLRRFTFKWIPVGLTVFLTFDFAIGIVFAYKVFTVRLLHDLVYLHFKALVVVSMCTTAVTDFLVGGLLMYTFAKSNVNLNWTNSSLTMLVAYFVNTGLITGIFSAAVLISFAVSVYNPVFIVFVIVLPQFYVNCFFSMLNAGTYFQTSQNSSGPSITHVLPYFHDELGFANPLLGSTIDSHSPPNSSAGVNLKLEAIPTSVEVNIPTINEIGLPLFKEGTNPEASFKDFDLCIIHYVGFVYSLLYGISRLKWWYRPHNMRPLRTFVTYVGDVQL
ncbi:hypothetical protein BDP27DRAFT_1421041 [Rhodocollybia butyracea]|uniref:DUF6534 domain-containing protein n=1 Tax=Rhodocollybia butyracea TaxID=206335 RepID=A0A9P5PNX5_9AGAR|nr:hypothetical protein BDP27DRAFT_1421041 [Rhodocollybia butyracea]